MRLALPPPRRNRIALTSLVDVVFILLFFFMLASQQLEWRALSVRLAPLAPDRSASTQTAETLVVLLLADGQLRLRGSSISLTALGEQIRARATPTEVVLVPAAAVPMQQLLDLIDALVPTGATVRLGRAGPAQ